MSEFRDFVAGLLERRGAAVEAVEPDGLDVLAPEALREAMAWPEFVRLGFGAQRPAEAIPIGLEGDWLDRFGVLLGEHGRWSERQVTSQGSLVAPADPERALDRAIDLPNAVWRLQGVTPTFSRCLVMAFRYTAVSDEKREGLIWIGFNLATGAVIDEIVTRIRPVLAQEGQWQVPQPEVRLAGGPWWDWSVLERRVRPLLDHRIREELDPFLRAMRRRLERDRNRVHAYYDDLRAASLKRLAASNGQKPEADRERERQRVAAIDREYYAKLDDLRHNYALRIAVEWVQTLELYLPVQRFDVLIRRRKSERLIRLDWHSVVRQCEPPPCDFGLGLDRVRAVCDEKLHLTEPAGQAPCPSCGKGWCRACHPASCPPLRPEPQSGHCR
jgi:hypothetical protein